MMTIRLIWLVAGFWRGSKEHEGEQAMPVVTQQPDAFCLCLELVLTSIATDLANTYK